MAVDMLGGGAIVVSLLVVVASGAVVVFGVDWSPVYLPQFKSRTQGNLHRGIFWGLQFRIPPLRIRMLVSRVNLGSRSM